MNTATTSPEPEWRDIPITGDPVASPSELPLDLLVHPLRGHVDWVRRRYGLDPVVACLTTLISVGCACGPGRQILSPVDDSFLPPALGVVFHGAVMHLGAAVNLSLDPLRRWLLNRLGPPDKREVRRVRLQLADLHRERTYLELQLANGGPKPAASPFGMIDPKEAAKLREQTRAKLAGTLGQIEATTSLLLPHVLADDAPLTQLLAPGRLSLDGAVLAASLSGDAVAAWSGASGADKVALARLLGLAWHGWPKAGDEQTHARPLLSVALVTDPEGARTLWNDRNLAGVNRHLFLVGNETEPVFDLDVDPDADAGDFYATLSPLITTRLEGRTVDHHLNKAATAHFQAFLNRTLAGTKLLPSDEAHRQERAPVLGLKLALLIHAVSPAQAEDTIDVPTVEFGLRLAEATCARDLDFTRGLVSVTAPPDDPTTNTPEDRKLSDLVEKLKLRGPLRWRSLIRSGHVQKEAPLRKLLVKGIEAGLIHQEGDLYSAVEPLQVA